MFENLTSQNTSRAGGLFHFDSKAFTFNPVLQMAQRFTTDILHGLDPQKGLLETLNSSGLSQNQFNQTDLAQHVQTLVDRAILQAGGSPQTLSAEQVQTIQTDFFTKWQGTPYKYGGNSADGIDCSHFVHQAYQSVGLDYGYISTSGDWSKHGFVTVDSPQPGDLILWSATAKESAHVGLVVDNTGKRFIGAQSSTGVANASYADQSYWGKRPCVFLHFTGVSTGESK